MRKNISIIFGGSFGLYYGIFTEIEKKFNCKIMRTSPFRLGTKINGIDIKFYFCNSPVRDNNYYSQKKYLQSSQWKELMPPPANEIAKKIKKRFMATPNFCAIIAKSGNALLFLKVTIK